MKKTGLLTMAALLMFANVSQAKNLVLAANTIKCGGYVSLEVSQESVLSLNVNLSRGSDCKNIQIDSQGINETLKSVKSEIALNPRQVGSVLPIEINDEVIVLNLSSADVQKQLSQSHTKEELVEMARQKREIEARRNREGAATAAVVGGAVLVGGAAVAADAAVSSER